MIIKGYSCIIHLNYNIYKIPMNYLNLDNSIFIIEWTSRRIKATKV